MKLDYQQSSIERLENIAKANLHSILIQGIPGSGKTYLSSMFAKMKKINTFMTCEPKVQELKSMLDLTLSIQDNQVICIENLDRGVNAASQVILKYLEEPLPNIYVIVTCDNISQLPSTIASRTITISIESPTKKDIDRFAKNLDINKYNQVNNSILYSSCKSLSDVKSIFSMNFDNIKYYDGLIDSKLWSQSSDSIVWSLGHYNNNDKTNLKYVFLCIMKLTDDKMVSRLTVDSLMSLESGRLSESAVLGKFVLDMKGYLRGR